jgi:hypothetical protein
MEREFLLVFFTALWRLVSLRFKTLKRTEPKMGFAHKASIIFAAAATKTPKLTGPKIKNVSR